MENLTEAAAHQVQKFSLIDYALFATMLLVSALIGIYFGCCGKKHNTTSEYLRGSRTMKVFPVAVSFVAANLSGITLLGIPAEIYMYGGQYMVCLISAILISIIVIFVYLPPFYKLQLNNSYDYLKIRFDDRIRIIALVLYIISSFLYIPIVIYIPALALNQVSDISIHLITPIICAICIFYTTVGGLKGVVWTDTIQFIVTLSTLFMIFILGVVQAGGFRNILEKAAEGDRLDFFNMDADPTIRTTFWGIVIGLTITWTSVLGIHPSSVQRFLSVPSLAKAKRTVIIFGFGVLLTKFLTCFSGFIMYAKYHDCDPFSQKKIRRVDQILPYYVLDVASNIPGLPGLFISGVFSTALSTMSAHLNTLAGALYENFFYKYMPVKTTDTMANNVIKSTVVIAGFICVGLVFLIEKMGTILQINACFLGITTGPMLGLFSLGMLFPSATTKGALYGSILALGIMAWIVIGFQYHFFKKDIQYFTKPLSTSGCPGFNETLSIISTVDTTTESSYSKEEPFYLFRLSFYWYSMIGAFLVVIIGLVVSYFSKEENESQKRFNKDLYCPLIHRFLPTDLKEYKTVEQALGVVKVEELELS